MSDDAIGFAAATIVFAAVVGLSCLAGSWTCSARASAMHLDSEWGPIIGCMVRVGDHAVPIGAYRVVAP